MGRLGATALVARVEVVEGSTGALLIKDGRFAWWNFYLMLILPFSLLSIDRLIVSNSRSLAFLDLCVDILEDWEEREEDRMEHMDSLEEPFRLGTPLFNLRKKNVVAI